jgi:hypothetical protein
MIIGGDGRLGGHPDNADKTVCFLVSRGNALSSNFVNKEAAACLAFMDAATWCFDRICAACKRGHRSVGKRVQTGATLMSLKV